MSSIKPAQFIAEIGCNHKGDMAIAKEMIQTAKFCKADVVKFQKRNNKELLSPDQYDKPHPVPYHAYGPSYGEHREYLEFTIEQHEELKAYCDDLNITYSTSVWDLTSAKEVAELNPKMIKVPSACNTNIKMLHWLCEHYDGDLHISTGMTTIDELTVLTSLLRAHDRLKDSVIYSCTSGYPVPFEDVCLMEIKRLLDRYGAEVKAIGFSGHHLGISVDIAAYTMGARVIERHFTLDRTWRGTDHAASLEPRGIQLLVRDLRAVDKAMTYKSDEILPIEQAQREKLKYRPA